MRTAEMRGLPRRILDRARESGGYTLTELLIAASLSLVIIGGGVGVFTAGLRSEPRIAERTSEIQQARVMMERITRELRQGATVVTATPNQLALVTFVKSPACGGPQSSVARSCRVTYTCSSGTCTRSEANPDGSGGTAATPITTGLSGGDVFTYSPSPAAARYVGVELEFPADEGDDSITLSDGVAMRNPAPPSS